MAQSTLFKALEDPSRYPGSVRRVARMDTHISCVLLAGHRAYKLKKAVDFGFLDYSTLARRRYFCEEELRLNRRLAPDLYLGVVPITGSPSQPDIDGAGEPIEYAVVMRRFRQSDHLPEVLARGALDARLVDALADRVGAFHRAIAVADIGSGWGHPDIVLDHMLDNFRVLEKVPDAALRKRLQRLEAWTRRSVTRLTPSIEARRRDGYVRECHGDLHLGNIALWRGQPIPFDGIEFEPELYWIDVLSDAAFLTMDLAERGAASLAHRFLDRYLALTGDYLDLELHTLYEVYRALVRAKVSHLTAANAGSSERHRLGGEIQRYLGVAEARIRPASPTLCITHGLSGSGKSTAALSLVMERGFLRLRSDVERKRLAGLGAADTSGSAVDQGLYTEDMNRATYSRLLELAEATLAAGRSTVVDATFLDRRQRDRFADLARSRGNGFFILAARAGANTLRQRIRQRRGDASEAGLAVLERQLARPHDLTAAEIDRAVIVEPGHSASDWLGRVPDSERAPESTGHHASA